MATSVSVRNSRSGRSTLEIEPWSGAWFIACVVSGVPRSPPSTIGDICGEPSDDRDVRLPVAGQVREARDRHALLAKGLLPDAEAERARERQRTGESSRRVRLALAGGGARLNAESH